MGESAEGYKILQNEKYGRYAVAKKALEPGDLIISESPISYGPKSDSVPTCLGCHTAVDCTVLCTTCGWPVCNETCEKEAIHSDNECKIFSSVGLKFTPVEDLYASCSQYECITPLRVLLAKERDPERWEAEVKTMEDHEDKRKESEVWRVEQVNIVEFLHKVCKLGDRFPEELIHFVCGILEVNAFAAHNRTGYEVRCLYPKTALLAHSCVPNVRHCIFGKSETNGDYHVYVRAAVKLEKGQEILLSYTHTLAPTLFRRAHLKEGKYFECSCPRCSDPTELGTNLSTLKCGKCDNGWVLSSAPLDETAIWKCTLCEFTTKGESVMRVFRIIQKEIDELDYSEYQDPVAAREALVKKYKSVLHPNNAFLLNMKYSLTQLYGRAEGYLFEDLPDIILERKIDLCRQILKVADVIKPGYSRQRGWNLYELHAPIVLYSRNQFQYKEIDEKALRVKLEEAAKYLEESAIILSFEDPQSAEGMTGKIAFESLKQLKESIQSLPN